MSTTAGARQMPQSPGGQAQPMPSGARQEQAGGLSLPAATALVIGSIIGTGVFTLPAVMAAGGTSSLAVLVIPWQSRRARAHGDRQAACPAGLKP